MPDPVREYPPSPRLAYVRAVVQALTVPGFPEVYRFRLKARLAGLMPGAPWSPTAEREET